MKVLMPLRTLTPYFEYFASLLDQQGLEMVIVTTRESHSAGIQQFPNFEWHIQPSGIGGYPEIFLGELISKLDSSWYLRLDSDEWMDPEKVQALSEKTKTLDKSVVYGLERAWVGKFPNSNELAVKNFGRLYWNKKSNHESSLRLHDQNYRLFHSDYTYPSRTLHGTGIVGGTYGSITSCGPIFHLDWLLHEREKTKNQSTKLSKFSIQNYDAFNDIYQAVDTLDSEPWMKIKEKSLEKFLNTNDKEKS